MKYYLHDTSAIDDEKVAELFIRFGYEGVGLFYVILEKIGKQEKPIKTLVLKSQLKVGKRLEKCWNFMEEIGLISSNNGETFNKQLLNYSEKYKIRKEKNAKRISEWRKNQESIENVTCYEQVCNSPKVNKSKVNEIKEKNAISKIPDSEFKTEKIKEIWHKWIQYKKEQFNDTYKSERSELTAFNQLRTLSKGSHSTAEKIVDRSIANLWKGLFRLDDKENEKDPNKRELYR